MEGFRKQIRYNADDLDKRICDCEGGENTETYREYIRSSEEEFCLYLGNLDSCSDVTISTLINWLDGGIENMFNRKMKNELEELKDKINVLEENNKDIKNSLSETIDENNRLGRIIKNYIPGKITYVNKYNYSEYWCYCYFYKDGVEYKIKYLNLSDATIEETKNNTLVIKDKVAEGENIRKVHEYAIDLISGSFVKLK